MTGILEGTLEVPVRSRKLDATKYKNTGRKSKTTHVSRLQVVHNPRAESADELVNRHNTEHYKLFKEKRKHDPSVSVFLDLP